MTSLSSAKPVANATIRLDAIRDDKFVTIQTGTTDANGAFQWSLAQRAEAQIKRIVVTNGRDTLVQFGDGQSLRALLAGESAGKLAARRICRGWSPRTLGCRSSACRSR